MESLRAGWSSLAAARDREDVLARHAKAEGALDPSRDGSRHGIVVREGSRNAQRNKAEMVEIGVQHRVSIRVDGQPETTMTPDQITLVQSSLPSILAIREAAAALFYDRLFEIDPTTRPLFSGIDMSQQGTKLMAAIAMVVGSLRRLETVERDIQKLAQRHVTYGVTSSHYESVGAALLWTLEKGLGSAFTPELRAAWTAAYGTLSHAMQHSATIARAA